MPRYPGRASAFDLSRRVTARHCSSASGCHVLLRRRWFTLSLSISLAPQALTADALAVDDDALQCLAVIEVREWESGVRWSESGVEG